MKLLIVSFGFPPRSQWGTEYYTHQLAVGLRERGHEVAVLHPVRDDSKPRYTFEQVESDGFPVYLIHNAGDPSKPFSDSYRNPRVEQLFLRVLDEWKPDLVHFMYLLWGMSARMPALCRERRVPSVVTLTDYGLLCHRGQMVDWRLQRCGGPHVAETCARCVREPAPYDGSPAHVFAKRWAARALAAMGGAGRVVMPADVERRMAVVRECFEAVDLFIAPTRVLERTFLAAGVPASKLVHATYALREQAFVSARTEPEAPPVRFGFLGQFMPHKGLGTLIEAVRILTQRLPESVEPWEVWLYGEGGKTRHRRYPGALLRSDLGGRLRVSKPFEPYQIASILAQLHAVVLPSAWDENAPLTALQARAAGVQVIASDVEGITEVVEHGKHGRVFPVGDATALADAMRAVILGDHARTRDPAQPMSYAEHLARLIGTYQHLLVQRAAAQGLPERA